MAHHQSNQIKTSDKSLTEKGKETIKPVARQAQEKAVEAKDQVQTQAKSAAETQKRQAASELSSVAQAIRTGGKELRNQNKETVAQYTEQIAEQIEQVSQYIDEKDVNQLVNDTADFARRRPDLFLGGAFMLGLAVGRFFTSTSDEQSSDYNYRPAVRPRKRVKYRTAYSTRSAGMPNDLSHNY